MQEEAIAAPCQWLLVEVTPAERQLTVSAVHDTLVRSSVARANPNESQPLLHQEAEADALVVQSLIDPLFASSLSPARTSVAWSSIAWFSAAWSSIVA